MLWPELLSYFGDPNISSVQSELRLVDGIFGPSNLLGQERLGLWGIGVTKVPWFTPTFSYCAWYVFCPVRRIYHTRFTLVADSNFGSHPEQCIRQITFIQRAR